MIDSHCHLEYMDDPESVLLEARKKHMRAVICSIPDPKDIGKILHIKDKHPTLLYLCFGLHPSALEENTDEEVDDYLFRIESERYDIVGIGEIGLEYDSNTQDDMRERQKATFEKFLVLAEKLKLPVVIHLRNTQSAQNPEAEKNPADVYADAFEILEKHKLRDVVLHCFSGSDSFLKRGLKNNYWISVGTNVCFTKKYPRIAAQVPLDRLLLETDAPWNNPDNPREIVNRPWNIEKSAGVIAKLHNTTKDEILKITAHNAKKVFGIA